MSELTKELIKEKKVSQTKKGKENKSFNLSENLYLYKFLIKELFGFDESNGRSFINGFLKSKMSTYNDFQTLEDIKELFKQEIFQSSISSTQILEYLGNINDYQDQITFGTEQFNLTYYQVFGLLLTEFYLDQYFNNFDNFSEKYKNYILQNFTTNGYSTDDEGNLSITTLSTSKSGSETKETKLSSCLSDLLKLKNKLVFWMATGSGKTIMMMINSLQYLRYSISESHTNVNNILIISPSSDLTEQHKSEFSKTGILETLNGNCENISFLEITKLKEEGYTSDGVSFDAISEFGDTNNLLLIDEGHRSLQGGKDSSVQKRIRDSIGIKSNSFTFEYSATYGQAVGNADQAIKEEYSNSIIWNYSYKFFNEDNYGKDFILDNVSEVQNKDEKKLNESQMIKILLSHIQQSLIYDTYKDNSIFQEYNIEKPLITIFGQKVADKGDSDKIDVSEVNQFIDFLGKVLQNKVKIETIQTELFSRELDEKGNLHFSDLVKRINKKSDFNLYLKKLILKYIFELNKDRISKVLETNETLFLEIERMKNNDLKEIGLKVSGEQNYFGLVYVGNPDDILSGNQKSEYIRESIGNNFRKKENSLFSDINHGKLSMIVGSKKFIMGWNNYRVSTMGLLEIGKGQGPTIIQVLGRGVRLKGKNYSLKRETNSDKTLYLDENTSIDISLLQSLNIIGINSSFMGTFESQLKEEGVTVTKQIEIKTTKREIPKELVVLVPKVVTIKEREKERVTFYLDSEKQNLLGDLDVLSNIQIDYDERIKKSKMIDGVLVYIPEHNTQYDFGRYLTELKGSSIFDYINWTSIYKKICDFKQSKKDLNNISLQIRNESDLFETLTEVTKKASIRVFLKEDGNFLFTLVNIKRVENFLLQILKSLYLKLSERIKISVENKSLGFRSLLELSKLTSYNLIPEQFIITKEDNNKIEEKLGEFSNHLVDLESLLLTLSNGEELKNITSLYTPLLGYSQKKDREKSEITSIPVALIETEFQFLSSLEKHLSTNIEKYKDYTFYILRNQSKKGIGFYGLSGFYPDFIIWRVNKITNVQEIHFIDPKGLINISLSHEKVQLFKELQKYSNENVKITSWLYSVTTKEDLTRYYKQQGTNINMSDFKENYHIIFESDFSWLCSLT